MRHPSERGHSLTRAIGYIRCSTDRQDDSLDQQRTKLEHFAADKGWTLVEVFADGALSGSDLGARGPTNRGGAYVGSQSACAAERPGGRAAAGAGAHGGG